MHSMENVALDIRKSFDKIEYKKSPVTASRKEAMQLSSIVSDVGSWKSF